MFCGIFPAPASCLGAASYWTEVEEKPPVLAPREQPDAEDALLGGRAPGWSPGAGCTPPPGPPAAFQPYTSQPLGSLLLHCQEVKQGPAVALTVGLAWRGRGVQEGSSLVSRCPGAPLLSRVPPILRPHTSLLQRRVILGTQGRLPGTLLQAWLHQRGGAGLLGPTTCPPGRGVPCRRGPAPEPERGEHSSESISAGQRPGRQEAHLPTASGSLTP